jgi:hypothetical protein
VLVGFAAQAERDRTVIPIIVRFTVLVNLIVHSFFKVTLCIDDENNSIYNIFLIKATATYFEACCYFNLKIVFLISDQY